MQKDSETKIGKQIRHYREIANLTQDELAIKVGYKSRSAIAKIESGLRDINQSQIIEFATALGVTPSILMGWDETKPSEDKQAKAFADAVIIEMPESVMIPVYGKIKAGVPLEAIEDIEEHIDVPAKWIQAGRKIIGLRVEGNSMYPRYFHNDIVVIECDTDYYSGDDCAVYVNGYDATIKTIKLHEEGIELIPVNTAFPPQHYKAGEYSILGKVIEMRRRF